MIPWTMTVRFLLMSLGAVFTVLALIAGPRTYTGEACIEIGLVCCLAYFAIFFTHALIHSDD